MIRPSVREARRASNDRNCCCFGNVYAHHILPTPVSPTASIDDFGSSGEYIVIGFVLGALAMAAGVLVVLWFVIH